MSLSATEHQHTQGYNGWANYETWCVHLWLTNDEGIYRQVSTIVRHESNGRQQAEAIKDLVEEMNPLLDEASLFSDLLNAALADVNWVEVAEAFVDKE